MKQNKNHRLHFAEEPVSQGEPPKARAPTKLRTDADIAKERSQNLRFGRKQKTPEQEPKAVQRPRAKVGQMASASASVIVHQRVSQDNEDENTGIQTANAATETGERLLRSAGQRYSNRLKPVQNASKLEQSAKDQAAFSPKLKEKPVTSQKASSNPISRRVQKHQIRQKYAAAKTAALRSGGTSAGATEKTAEAVQSFGNKAKQTLQQVFRPGRTPFKWVLLMGMVLLLIVAQVQSCTFLADGVLTSVTTTSWPADDQEITKAEAYYSKLEAQLQRDINRMEQSHSGCGEYNYNLSEIGHDPQVLISYLCAKYGDFTFRQVKRELDTLFNLQYDLDVETQEETREVTRTVRVGEEIGEVVTSGYCNCSICCGRWSGGPTASGVYPTANHTIAVDAHNPTLPLGTEIIMNGTLYKVEDTGAFARYGVDFDVYYDSHSAALSHGHQTWTAYYAGGSDGEEIEITTTETVDVCYVTLTADDLASIAAGRMDEEQTQLYEVYQMTRGNRVFFATPLPCDWHQNIIGSYGSRCDGTSITESDWMDLSVPVGTWVQAVMDATVERISGDTITLVNEHGYQVQLKGCTGIRVSVGDSVEREQKIARVSGDGLLQVSFRWKGRTLNPYFYLDVGEGILAGGISGEASGKAAMLINKARQYLGVPYVWGGYSPSGFDCSGFVSYCINYCGAGFNFGRLTAEGWHQRCQTISEAQARPGDLVFFEGTYDTAGASHVGIYIGNGQMIHAGSPIKISNIHSSYFQRHFLCFGRIPGM